ncbi:protease modulator HflC [Oceanicella actignis]|uniref:Protein HflC n=1 Tax=Oceanicella actignis TaxID=1189325 RepID=A0A1M7SBK1_9RHOB|nr:protease modulator HflC [Oceanicella actignis]TYO91506.1 membrane protease subunit HflC [Oceanicella actignis]SET26933.1 protease FtsH subunit HflC [Oceanicella actignis]SHN55890.1 membrane protease subunit HflC [Oceanicella actignis]
MKKGPVLAAVLAALVFVLANSVFIVDERQQALKLQFGKVVGDPDGYRQPGLYFKIPFIQNVVYYEDRILPLETSELEITPLDDRRLVVDAFARWRIVDPLRFRQAVQTEAAALPRLERILNAALREVLGSVMSDNILSDDRAQLMARIRDAARGSAATLGVQIIDVRIRRADLPQQNLQATFERMKAERVREAADERARGAEAAQRVRANADRQAVELVSEARRDSEIIRGEADAKRNRIFAEAFGRDPEFFAFYRSLGAYEKSIQPGSTTLVLTPGSEFFEYLGGGADRDPRRGMAE